MTQSPTEPVMLTRPADTLMLSGAMNHAMTRCFRKTGKKIAHHAYSELADTMRRTYGFAIGKGSFRTAYESGAVVVKVPLDYKGAISNLYEYAAYKGNFAYRNIPVAPCEIFWHESGIPILVMEAVKPATTGDLSALPRWAHRIDARQVGKRASGEWVVYDAGCRPRRQRFSHYPNPTRYVRPAALPEIFREAA